MHEALFDDDWLKGTGVSTLDFAKAMIDEGYHPMTMYFPLVVHGAMLIEPTESESKASLDLFIATLRDLAMAAKGNDKARFTGAPHHAPDPPPRRDPRRPPAGAEMDQARAGGGGGGVGGLGARPRVEQPGRSLARSRRLRLTSVMPWALARGRRKAVHGLAMDLTCRYGTFRLS